MFFFCLQVCKCFFFYYSNVNVNNTFYIVIKYWHKIFGYHDINVEYKLLVSAIQPS